MPAIIEACNLQVNSANAADWPEDLSSLNLSKYLKNVPELDRWWTLPLPSASAFASASASASVIQPVVDQPDVVALADDGMIILFCILCL